MRMVRAIQALLFYLWLLRSLFSTVTFEQPKLEITGKITPDGGSSYKSCKAKARSAQLRTDQEAKKNGDE